ncbi:MAG: regulatory protein GemA [Magnetococcales bacterium]|nr:regulatory protein GemA [Magnetococcales bacterium]
MALTRKQSALIHIAKRDLSLDDANYRSILIMVAGVRSSKDLDIRGFNGVMEHFEYLGFKSTNAKKEEERKESFGSRPGMATPAQVKFIRSLWRSFADHPDDAALGRWLEKKFKISALRFLDNRMAAKAIQGLKAMVKRKREIERQSRRIEGESQEAIK